MNFLARCGMTEVGKQENNLMSLTKICSIACIPHSSVEGPATHLRELHAELVKFNCQIDLWLVDIGLPSRIEIPLVKINTIRTPNIPVLRFFLFDLLLFFRLSFQFINAYNRPQVIYLRQSYSTILIGVLSWIYRIPLIVEVNGFFAWDLAARNASFPIRWASRLGEFFSFKRATWIICVTQGIKDELDRIFAIKKKTVVIRNGVNLKRFHIREKQECREKLGLPIDRTIMGYIGCFTPWDGIKEMIEIIPGLTQRHPQLYFLLVGDGYNQATTKKRMVDLQLQPFIHFTGFIEHSMLNDYIASFDFALAPYIPGRNRMGVSSLKCLEYFACGIPAVVGAVPEMDYVESSGGGVLFNPGDWEDFTAKVSLLLDHPERLGEMGKKARAYVVNHSSWQNIAQKTWEVIHRSPHHEH